jgi:hypothetical protein
MLRRFSTEAETLCGLTSEDAEKAREAASAAAAPHARPSDPLAPAARNKGEGRGIGIDSPVFRSVAQARMKAIRAMEKEGAKSRAR